MTIMWKTDGLWGLTKRRQRDKLGGHYHCQGEMIEVSANMIRRVDRIGLVYLCISRT